MTALENLEANLQWCERDDNIPVSYIRIEKWEGMKLLREIRELRANQIPVGLERPPDRVVCYHESMSYIGNYPSKDRWRCSKCGYVTP